MNLETKLLEKRTGYVQYQIKFKTNNGTQGVAVVGLDGWDHDQGENRNNYANTRWHRSTKGNQVRLSMNGPAWLSVAEWKQLTNEIEDCYANLWADYPDSRKVEN